MISSFKQGTYRRQVAVLVSGTAAAQALPIAASPILTRLYTPEDFGLLALYGSVAGILMSLSTAQYELAITLPAKDEDAATVVSLCIRVCTVFSLVLLIVVLLFNQQLAIWIGHPEIAVWLYLLPLSVFASGLFQTYSFWCNRRSAYGLIARQTFKLSAVTVACSIAFGIASVAGGQILSALAGRIASTAGIVHAVHKKNNLTQSKIPRKTLRQMAKKYSAHPLYFMPSQLINEFAMQIPVFMMSNLFLMSTVGFFSLANRLVALPTSLIANAIGSVYRQRISESYNRHGNFRKIYLRTLLVTLMASIVPFGLLYLVAPTLFAVVFGEKWRVAGSYAQILMVSTFFSFVTTPLNTGSIVVGAKHFDLAWKVIRFAFYALLWFAAFTLELQVETVLWCFVIGNVCLYCIDVAYQYKLSGGQPDDANSSR